MNKKSFKVQICVLSHVCWQFLKSHLSLNEVFDIVKIEYLKIGPYITSLQLLRNSYVKALAWFCIAHTAYIK